jgi:hypothetical protein
MGARRSCARREELAALFPFRPPLQRDPDVGPIWMGQSAGSVHGVRSVAEVIGELCDSAERSCASDRVRSLDRLPPVAAISL